MLHRVLESEVMDTEAEAVDYDAMDHTTVNRVFIEDFLVASDGRRLGRVLDVGTATAHIPIELCKRNSPSAVTAIDLADEMLKIARRNVANAALESRIVLERVDAKSLPYDDGSFDAVISNSIVHHIPDPVPVFSEMGRVLCAGGVLFVRDLLRPADVVTLEQLVQSYAGEANEHQRQMFRASLHAAFTLEEVERMLTAAGLPYAIPVQTSDRHWTLVARV